MQKYESTWTNMAKQCPTLVLNKDVPFLPHYSAYILMRLSKIFCVYLMQWLPFFSMSMMMLMKTSK